MHRLVPFISIVILLVAISPVNARQDVKLKPGDAAPPIAVGRWIKGNPVTRFEPGKVYAILFWSTWSAPSRAVLPIMNDIQKKFADKGVIVVAQSVAETDEDAVEPFVIDLGDKVGFRVAVDDRAGSAKGTMTRTWMDPAGLDDVPVVFLIDQGGKLAWIGHPSYLEEFIEKVLAGTNDYKAAEQHMATAATERDEFVKVSRKLEAALARSNWDAALSIAQDSATRFPSTARTMSLLKFNVLLRGKQDYAAAYAVAEENSKAFPDDFGVLNDMAWTILDTPGLTERNFDLAIKLSERANELAKGESAAVLDTLGRAYWEKGNKAKAIEAAKKAIEKSDDASRAQLLITLEKYQKGK